MTELSIDKSNWTKVKFGDVVFEPKESVKDARAEGIMHVVGLEHIDSEDIHLRRSNSIDESTTFTKKFSKGDVLFGRRRAYLKKAAQADFSGICSGGLSPRVKFKDLAQFELYLPPLKEQVRFLELLSASDNMRETDKQVLAKLSIYLETFRERVLCNEVYPRAKIGNGLDGISAGKSLSGVNIPVINSQKGVLKVSAVGADGFVEQENKALEDQCAFIDRFSVKEGDVLITRANTTELVGRTCLVNKDYPNLMLSDKTLKLDLVSTELNPIFIVEVLRSYQARRQIESYATGTGGAMKNITQDEIKSIKIPYPDIEEQNLLGTKLNEIKTTRASLMIRQCKARVFQKSLINQVF